MGKVQDSYSISMWKNVKFVHSVKRAIRKVLNSKHTILESNQIFETNKRVSRQWLLSETGKGKIQNRSEKQRT